MNRSICATTIKIQCRFHILVPSNKINIDKINKISELEKNILSDIKNDDSKLILSFEKNASNHNIETLCDEYGLLSYKNNSFDEPTKFFLNVGSIVGSSFTKINEHAKNNNKIMEFILEYACDSNNMDLIHIFVEKSCDNYNYVLQYASKQNNIRLCMPLIQKYYGTLNDLILEKYAPKYDYTNRINILQLLIDAKKNADLDKAVNTALSYNQLSNVILLIKHGAKIRENLLWHIVREPWIDDIQYLVENRLIFGDPSSYLLTAVIQKQISETETLWGEIIALALDKSLRHNHKLYVPQVEKYNQVLELLLQNKADPNANNGEPLINAISCEDNVPGENPSLTTINLLIKYGADVKINNNAAIIDASKYARKLNIFKILIDNNADVNARNGEPLINVSWSKDRINFLLENGANIHAQNNMALLVAIGNNYVESTKKLIECGANIHDQNNLIIKVAKKNMNPDIIQLLLENNVDVNKIN